MKCTEPNGALIEATDFPKSIGLVKIGIVVLPFY